MEPSRDRRSRQATFVLSAGALAGVLIWSKLRLVTDIPRSAYAEPDRAQPERADAAETPETPMSRPDETPEPGGSTENDG